MERLFVTVILDKILWCYHSNETSSKGQNVSIDLLSNFLKLYEKKFESFFEFLWPLSRVKSKAGFYMSWKSQTFREFTVSRKLCRLMKSRDDRISPIVWDGWGQVRTNTSQVCVKGCVPTWHMRSQVCCVGMSRSVGQLLFLLGPNCLGVILPLIELRRLQLNSVLMTS